MTRECHLMETEHLLAQYKKAVDESTIVSKTDLKGIITYANDEFCRVAKYSREELLGKPHNIVRHPSMPKAAFEQVWQTIQSGQTWRGVVTNRAKDGSAYIVDATIVPLTNAGGEIVEYIAIRKEITEYLRQRALLEQYKLAVDASTIVSKTDKKGVITYANAQFCRISKYSREELIGQPHNIVRHPDVPKAVFAELWDRIQAGHIWQGLVPNRAKDGSTYVVDATIVPIKNPQGVITGYIAVRKDVTELTQRRDEADRLNSEVSQRLEEATDIKIESLLEAIGLPAVVIDRHNRCMGHNDNFEGLFGPGSATLARLREGTLDLTEILQNSDGHALANPLIDWKELALHEPTDLQIVCDEQPARLMRLHLGSAPGATERYLAIFQEQGDA